MHPPAIRQFDEGALYAALDAKRQTEGLSWPGAAAAIWDLATVLNTAREARGLANHPISPSTLRSLGNRGDTSCQHALFRELPRPGRTRRRYATAGLRPGPPPALGSEGRVRWS